jgi:hypothetical protein
VEVRELKNLKWNCAKKKTTTYKLSKYCIITATAASFTFNYFLSPEPPSQMFTASANSPVVINLISLPVIVVLQKATKLKLPHTLALYISVSQVQCVCLFFCFVNFSRRKFWFLWTLYEMNPISNLEQHVRSHSLKLFIGSI